jgi:hypothetical protein
MARQARIDAWTVFCILSGRENKLTVIIRGISVLGNISTILL